MKPKFEIGDKVIEKEPCFGGYGYVTSINHYNDPDCYVVKFANGDERVSYIEDFCVEDSEIKAAFLTRLQELLATFDAVINVGWNNGWQTDDAEYPLIDMDVVFKDGTGFCYDNVLDRSITAENVFDYDKD